MREPQPAPRPGRRRRAITLVEVMICLAILGSALGPLAYAVLSQAHGSKDLEGRLAAQALVQNTLETLAGSPFEALGGMAADPASPLLPPVEPGLHRAVSVVPVPGVDPKVLCRVRVEVRWEVEGRVAVPTPRQILVREQLVTNRKASLTHDGIVH